MVTITSLPDWVLALQAELEAQRNAFVESLLKHLSPQLVSTFWRRADLLPCQFSHLKAAIYAAGKGDIFEEGRQIYLKQQELRHADYDDSGRLRIY